MPTTDAVGLHDLRIAYKELRYASELLAPALAVDLAAMAEPAAKFQKRLGEIHDADMALATVGRARGLGLAVQAEMRASLDALRAKRVAKYVAEMAPAEIVAADAAEPTPTATPPSTTPRAAKASLASPRPRASSAPKRAKLTPSAASRSGRSPASSAPRP